MNVRYRSVRALAIWFAIACVVQPAGTALAASDWDLYMLRLVNRARQAPSAESGIIGSSVVESLPPVPPLAYHASVAQASANHNNWMHANFGSISSGNVPDSLTHYETLDGQSGGTPATGTPSYTGVTVGARLTAAGFAWSWSGENIRAVWGSLPITIDKARIDSAHKAWWESYGHRINMLNGNFTVFGHRVESRSFTPPRGGFPVSINNIHFATQSFARPMSSPYTYIFGLVYTDVDGSGGWTPRSEGDPQREGLGGVTYDIYLAGTMTRVAGGVTLANGAFSVNRGNGVYDLVFAMPNGDVTISNVVVSGANVDAGDIKAILSITPQMRLMDCMGGPSRLPQPNLPGITPQECVGLYDFDGDSDVDMRDYSMILSGPGVADASDPRIFDDCLSGPGKSPAPKLEGLTSLVCLSRFDTDGDGDVDLHDYAALMESLAN